MIKRTTGTILLAVVLCAAAHAGDGDPAGTTAAPAEAPATAAPVHSDAEAVETALLEALRAFLSEDTAGARAQLDRIEELSRRLGYDDEETLGERLVGYDRAFHVTLDQVRSLSGKGHMDAAFDQFIYVQRACVACHRIARGEDD